MARNQKNWSWGFAAVVVSLLVGPSAGRAQVAGPIEKFGLSYDKAAKSSYAAYADERVLHVHLETVELSQQRKIAQNGLELWIDVKGKKNKKVGVQYPLANAERSFSPPSRGDTGRIGILHGIQSTLAKKNQLTAAGFAGRYNGTRPILPDTGLSARITYKGDTMVYDAEIPLEAFVKALPPHATISIGLVEKGLLPPGMGEGGMPGEGGGPGGGPGGEGGPGGGGPGGPGGGGPPPGGGGPGDMPDFEEMQQAFKDDIIWFSVTLP